MDDNNNKHDNYIKATITTMICSHIAMTTIRTAIMSLCKKIEDFQSPEGQNPSDWSLSNLSMLFLIFGVAKN